MTPTLSNNFGKQIAERLGLDAGTVVGIDIHIEPGNLVTVTAKLFLKESQAEGLGIIFDEMEFVGVRKKKPVSEAVPKSPQTRPGEAQFIYKSLAAGPRAWFPWLAIAILATGCSQPPAPPQDLRPWIATSGMYSLMSPSPAPLPPSPTPGAKCENCRGTGIVGDGRTGITCPVCNGTGVAPSQRPPASPETPVSSAGGQTPPPARFAAPGPPEAVSVGTDGGPTFRVVCEDGVCRRIKVQSATAR